jgi:hypothetical protein
MALTIGYIARFSLGFVLLAIGIFLVYSGYYLGLMIVLAGWLVSLTGASVVTYNEMRRINEGIGGAGN